MDTAEDKEKLIELLNTELGLTPYESKVYMSVLLYGPLSPQGVNQKSGVPRPRAYDVLNSLIGKGLLMEQPGRPTVYAALPPKVALHRMVVEIEKRTLRQLEEKKKISDKLSDSLSRLHERTRGGSPEEEIVWVTRRDSAFITRYCEAIRNIEKEMMFVTPQPRPPEEEIIEAARQARAENKSIRIIRQVTRQWTAEDLDLYEQLIKEGGDQIRSLKYDGLGFAVFDKRDSVLFLPGNAGSQLAVWLSFPKLSEILCERFEVLWNQAEEALPIIKRMKDTKG